MKKLICTRIAICFLISIAITYVNAQQLTWTTKSPEAKAVFKQGLVHYENNESELAYHDFKDALKLDPDFTMAQNFLSFLTRGDASKAYNAKAKQSLAGKSEGEKLLVSMYGDTAQAQFYAVWQKLNTLYPDDTLVQYFYSLTTTDSIQALNNQIEYVKKYPSRPEGYNNLGYLYLQQLKDTATAKMYFEKYIALYPDGYNPYDSYGEFFYIIGDYENSKKYYKMALEHYPFCYSSRRKLEDLNKMK